MIRFNNVSAGIRRGARNAKAFVIKRSPELLLITAVASGVSSVIMVNKAAPKAKQLLEERHDELAEQGIEMTKTDSLIDDVKTVGPLYLPAIAMGMLAIGCTYGSYHITSRRTAALTAAYSLSESRLREYQQKLIDSVGEKKAAKIRDEIADTKIKNDPSPDPVFDDEEGQMCYDIYFNQKLGRMTRQQIEDAVNRLNKRMMTEMYMSVADLYSEIPANRIPPFANDLGWHINKDMIEVRIGSHLNSNGVACLSLDYDTIPFQGYQWYGK